MAFGSGAFGSTEFGGSAPGAPLSVSLATAAVVVTGTDVQTAFVVPGGNSRVRPAGRRRVIPPRLPPRPQPSLEPVPLPFPSEIFVAPARQPQRLPSARLSQTEIEIMDAQDAQDAMEAFLALVASGQM